MSDQQHVLNSLLERIKQRKRGPGEMDSLTPSSPGAVASPPPLTSHHTAEFESEEEETNMADPFVVEEQFEGELPNVDTAVRSVPFVAQASSVEHEALRPGSIAPPSIPIAKVISAGHMDDPLTFGLIMRRALSLRPK
jgi:hypothetical protein